MFVSVRVRRGRGGLEKCSGGIIDGEAVNKTCLCERVTTAGR